LIGALAISTDNYYRAYVIWNRYSAVLNNYLEYSLDDNHTVNLSFQSTSMHCVIQYWQRHDMVFILVHSLNLTD